MSVHWAWGSVCVLNGKRQSNLYLLAGPKSLSTLPTLEKYGKMLKDNSFIHPHSIFPKNRSALLLSEEFQPACRRQWPLPLLFSLSSPSLRALATWKWILANWGTLDRSEKIWLAAIGCWCSMVVPCFWLNKYCIEVRLPHLLGHALRWLKSTTIVWLYILYIYVYIYMCVFVYIYSTKYTWYSIWRHMTIYYDVTWQNTTFRWIWFNSLQPPVQYTASLATLPAMPGRSVVMRFYGSSKQQYTARNCFN